MSKRLLPFVLLLAGALRGATVDPALHQELRWRLIGPFRGGRVCAVTGVPGQPEHFYFGSVNGGVWETRDAGRTWQPIFDDQPIGTIGAIAVAPSNPNVLYVGSGEADMRSDIAQGNGMYRSSDGGKTWSHIGLEDSQQIARIRVHPTNPDLVYVAVLGHPYAANAERGLFRSRDGGKTWQRVLSRNGDSDTGAVDVAFEPGNPNVLYAALWQTRRTPWSVYPPSNGPGSGLFKSIDGGDTWTEIRGNGFPEKPGRMGVAVATTNPRRVYIVADAPEGGVFRSDDAGATWTRTTKDARVWSRGWYFGEIAVEPDNADVVYSMNINFYRSDDAGATFVAIKGAPGGDDYHALWIDPQQPARKILGVDQGAVVTVNNGRTWSSWYNQPTAQLYHVSTDNSFPYRVYGAQQDSGAASLPSRTNTIDGVTLMNFRETTAGGESDSIAPDPKDPDVIFGGRVDKLDLRTQQTRSVDPTLAYPSNDRRTWTLPLVFSIRDPRVLYFANQRLYRTDDGGEHWTIISPDLTREDPGTPPNLDPVTAALHQQTGPRRGVIYTIAPSRVADRDLWVGTDDGLIWRTKDEGAHWQNVTPAAITSWSKIGILDASHFDAETAYAAVDRHRLDDFRPYIYRTHDGGKSWQLIVSGIPTNFAVNVVREDAVRKGLLYAGTERGIFVSFDDGDHWQPLQKNLPVTSVRDIDVHDKDLVIATHGRGFWIMDDVTPLRQDVVTRPFLFKPAIAVRERPAGFTGTPMPRDEPLAPNPPQGAYIDYVLDATTGPVTLEIVDAQGALVRRYSSADAPPALDLTKARESAEWFVTPSTLQTTPGMHRFVWPIRAEGTRGKWSNGIWAPPGDYRVVLTVNGQRLEQPLRIVPDPRVKLPMSAYAEQHALAMQIDKVRADVAAAIAESDTRLEKIVNDETMRARIRDIAGVATAFGSTTGPNEPPRQTTLRAILSALENLLDAVDGADAAPSADARASFAAWKGSAEKALAAWKAAAGT
ncbi:MAG TPA: hypothetical protein VJZ00_00880 [Thermoanaerobaculia bacterium]|nr:hypothetical protein [Thermoanaerobaculia bacterium]